MLIPFSRPQLGDEEVAAATRVLRSDWLARGPECEAFEQEFREYVGAKYAVSLSSCSAALHLAVLAYGIGPGDRVACPVMTFPSAVNSILMAGAEPVLVDCGYDYNTRYWSYSGVKAAILTDMHGLPVEASSVPATVIPIRDAAHSVGAPGIGSDGLTTCFSFYATKNFTSAGNGGMLVTDDEQIYQTVKRLSLFGMDKDAWKRYQPQAQVPWDVFEQGFKYDMSDLSAAIGRAQLQKLPTFLAQRMRVARAYNRLLAPLAERGLLILPPDKPAWHVYAIRVANRDQVAEQLKSQGIGVGIHFRPLHQLAYLKRYATGSYRIAELLGSQTLSLPFHPSLTTSEIATVVETLEEILDETVPL